MNFFAAWAERWKVESELKNRLGEFRMRLWEHSRVMSFLSPPLVDGLVWHVDVPNGTVFLSVTLDSVNPKRVVTHWFVADGRNRQVFEKTFVAVTAGCTFPVRVFDKVMEHAATLRHDSCVPIHIFRSVP